MSLISEKFADELCEKEMRDAYTAAQTRTRIANQIRAIRLQRGWSQGDFAKALRKPQSNVSRMESREYGSFTLSTLLELAATFDVGLVVEFATYEEFLKRTNDLSPAALQVARFDRAALAPLCRKTQVPVVNAAVPQPPENFVHGSEQEISIMPNKHFKFAEAAIHPSSKPIAMHNQGLKPTALMTAEEAAIWYRNSLESAGLPNNISASQCLPLSVSNSGYGIGV